MSNRKTSMLVLTLLFFIGLMISACIQPYPSSSLETPTVISTNLFVSPLPTSDNPMEMIGEFASSTALAETSAALTAGTLPATASTTTTSSTGTQLTPDSNITKTPTGSAVATNVTSMSTLSPTVTDTLPTVTVNRPSTYTLQKGEFPYCIARRFNVDPTQLLNLNSLASGDVYYPSLTLKIPQSGDPFPGSRAWHSRPDTYTVESSDTSLYGVACYYGDIDPATIAQANNLQLTATLTVGQKLTIPGP